MSSYSTDLQTSTGRNDSLYVSVLYSRVVKANQALIEIPHRRFQVSLLENQVLAKDSVIKRLILANKICHQINVDYSVEREALVKKGKEYDILYRDYKSEAKRANNNALALKVTTPVVIVVVAVASFFLGFYLHK